MSNVILDKETVKNAVKELIAEDPNIIRQALKEIFTLDQESENQELQLLIKKNFERFDKTFKALA